MTREGRHSEYRDEGCDLAPSCLNCPFPLCRHDDHGLVNRSHYAERNDEVVRLRREEGLGVAELAARFALSKRTVQRILSQQRQVLL